MEYLASIRQLEDQIEMEKYRNTQLKRELSLNNQQQDSGEKKDQNELIEDMFLV